jgi:hypothetical protein
MEAKWRCSMLKKHLAAGAGAAEHVNRRRNEYRGRWTQPSFLRRN